jgi:Ala-tRNA(Pro) deacylase
MENCSMNIATHFCVRNFLIPQASPGMKDNPDTLIALLDKLNIPFEIHHHPAAPTIQEAMKYWGDMETGHCKNLFFRNHKGNRHYLVLVEHAYNLNIRELELRLKQGKISFASEHRLYNYLGVKPGAVTPFGLINDANRHVKLFIDEKLQKREMISFHPLINTASLRLGFPDFIRFLSYCGNEYEFVKLYEMPSFSGKP